jgi:hypothetical protein
MAGHQSKPEQFTARIKASKWRKVITEAHIGKLKVTGQNSEMLGPLATSANGT